MNVSKTQIDKVGRALSDSTLLEEEAIAEFEDIFDQYRKEHLDPLTRTTLEMQKWLSKFDHRYYIAQRLKRKPQILRKLRRLSVRLTQLQDIGGLRIIVDTNKDVDTLRNYIEQNIKQQDELKLIDIADYRNKGREDSGYRSMHILLARQERRLELQLRSRIQHYWAESIERTSVLYKKHLKELEGDNIVINYFKHLSDVFYEFESGREPSPSQKIQIDHDRDEAEKVIGLSADLQTIKGSVNGGVIKALIEKEKRKSPSSFNNWILIMDWNSGCFVTWDIIERDPDNAIRAYVRAEKNYPAEQGFEVVMIGSSDIETTQETHSHYFGIKKYENILEDLESSFSNVAKRMELDTGARQILLSLVRKKHWNTRVSCDTLKNHFCKNVFAFDDSLQTLIEKGLVLQKGARGGVKLNIKVKAQIESYI